MHDQLLVWLQSKLPQKRLSVFMSKVAKIEWPWFKDPLIYWFAERYGVNWDEAKYKQAEDYQNFHAFFTRELKAGARRLQGDEFTLVSPVDGTLSQFGLIQGGQLIQAKNKTFSLSALLGKNEVRVQQFENGQFLTIYLAPKDYHRVHMPTDAQLNESLYIPGRLFSVNPTTANQVDNLFAINERLVVYFDTPTGPIAVIFVGALIVGGIETKWAGEITPPHRDVKRWIHNQQGKQYARGEEIGRFAMGSTIIVLLSQPNIALSPTLKLNQTLQMGHEIARFK